MSRAGAPCTEPGCWQLKPCPTHKPTPWAGSNRRATLPRGWANIRRRTLQRDNHTCVLCGAPATDVDHINNPNDHTPANLRSLCHPCHDQHTKAQAAAGRARAQQP